MAKKVKKKKTRKSNIAVFNVPLKYADDVKRLLDRLEEDDQPRKPIKRVRKIEPEYLRWLTKDVKAMTKRFAAVEKEIERIEHDYDDDEMRPSDAKWYHAYRRELAKPLLAGDDLADIVRENT